MLSLLLGNATLIQKDLKLFFVQNIIFLNWSRIYCLKQKTISHVSFFKAQIFTPPVLCNPSFIHYALTNACFAVVTNPKETWEGARQQCLQRNATLGSIHNAGEDAFLGSLSQSDHLWIGMTDQHLEGNWSWVDQTQLDYERWAPNQPNNFAQGQHCGRKTSGEMWGDFDCSLMHAYVCRINL